MPRHLSLPVGLIALLKSRAKVCLADNARFSGTVVDAGVPGLPHIVNATITVSVLSIGLSCVYAGSRTLMALAEQGYAPKVFTYVDKAGRPLWAVCAILAFFPMCVACHAQVIWATRSDVLFIPQCLLADQP